MSLDLDALQKLAEAATPGAWVYYNGDVWLNVTAEELAAYDADPGDGPGPWARTPEPTNLTYGDYRSWADAEFIAASRTAVPELLQEVKRLRALITEAGIDAGD